MKSERMRDLRLMTLEVGRMGHRFGLIGSAADNVNRRHNYLVHVLVDAMPELFAEIDRLNMVVLEQLALANKHLGQLREWLEPAASPTDHHGCSDERCRQCYGEP